MERINLLPEEARLSLGERVLHIVGHNFPKVLGGTVGAIAALTLISFAGQAMALHRGRKALQSLRKQMEVLEVETKNQEAFAKQLDQVEQELERQKSGLELKLAYLDAAKSRPRVMAKMLRDLRQNIPQGVWLTELETEQGNILRIAGGATDENLVTQFMANLKASPSFADVGFTYTEKDSIGRVPIVKFEVVCRIP